MTYHQGELSTGGLPPGGQSQDEPSPFNDLSKPADNKTCYRTARCPERNAARLVFNNIKSCTERNDARLVFNNIKSCTERNAARLVSFNNIKSCTERNAARLVSFNNIKSCTERK